MMERADGRITKRWHRLPVAALVCAGMLVLIACGQAEETPWPTRVLPAALPHAMKGYELYSWQADGGWRFTLITGTNRSKRYEEVVAAESVVTGADRIRVSVEGSENLATVLERLPVGETISWRCGRWLEGRGGADIVLPDRALVEEIEATCRRLGIQLEVLE